MMGQGKTLTEVACFDPTFRINGMLDTENIADKSYFSNVSIRLFR